MVSNPTSSGGVLGYYSINDWGSLGYYSSAAVAYGAYYCALGGGLGTGTGYLPSANITGIGFGSYGGVMGGWTKGAVMGQLSCGEMFATYNMGNMYTSGYSAEVVALKDRRVPAYTVTSTDIKVYNDGTGKLQNGRIHVTFDEAFIQLIGNHTPVVTVTPMGQCNGVYITNVTARGFDVVELNNGTSDVEFSYIVVGKRIDAKDKPELPDALAKKNFDETMQAVMHNENNTEHSGLPVWWDGTQLRFDTPPPMIKKEEAGH